MKILFLILSFSALASDHCTSNNPLVNQDIASFGTSGCSETELKKPCSDCALPLMPFEKVKASLGEIQEKLLKVAFDEYKKVAISNIVDIAKTRSLDNPHVKFSQAKLACKVKTEVDFPKGCNPKAIALMKKSDLFDGFNKQVANEIASIVSKKPTKLSPTLLTRNSNSCHISEQTLLQVSASVLAETFDPEFISVLQKIPKGTFKSIKTMLESDAFYEKYGEGVTNLTRYMKSNPLLTDFISTPDQMIDFFAAVPQPLTLEKIKAHLYNNKQNEDLDSKFAKKCNESFKALGDFLCSEAFAKGDVDLELNHNYAHLFNKDFVPEENPADSYYAQKMQAKKFCNNTKTKDALRLSQVNQKISQSLESLLDSKSTLNQFQEATYQKDFSSMADLLCKDEPCLDMKNIRCRFMDKYKKTKIADSLDSKLANSSNDEVNALLRSMIGAPEKLDKETKDVLISEGILPDSSGKVASTGNIPERQPKNFSQAAPPAMAPVTSNASANTQASQQTQAPYVAPFPNSMSARNPASSTEAKLPSIPDYSDLFSDSQDLKRIQDEIGRRLTEPSATKPKNIQEAKKVVRESMNSFPSRPNYLKPNAETVMAQRILDKQEPSSGQNSLESARESAAASAAINEKWKKETHNSAMESMYGGAKSVEKRNEEKKANPTNSPMQKVALNIPDDNKINLSEVFNKKLNTNDAETQMVKVLLKSESDFVLKINNLDFKVEFDETKKFRVLLTNGDKEEASRLRPQLEIFLKRLNEK